MGETVIYDRQGDVAVLRLNNPPVNALSQAVRQGLSDGLQRAETEAGIRALLLVGEGRGFIAGADIREFGKPLAEPSLPALCSRLEASPLLVVAAMHGVSLGGGLEVALACHYRIAQADARVGLPEVHLGLIPGAGGTQRLPRLIGAEAAIATITTGRHIPAEEALSLGLVDRVVDAAPLEAGLTYVRDLLDTDAPRRPVGDLPAAAPVDWDAAEKDVARRARGQIAPGVAVRAVRASVEQPFEAGLAEERRLFSALMETDQRKGMIHAFFAERRAAQVPEIADVAPRDVHHIGVVGGGTMGSGIAASALLAGLDVVLLEQDEAAAEAARARVAQILDGAVGRGKIDAATRDAKLGSHFSTTADFDALAEVQLVVEAAFEDLSVKTRIFERLAEVCAADAVLATNTSYLDVNAIAAATQRPERVLGLHFFSPAHVMKLIEIVVADRTAPDVVATGFSLARRLRKVGVRAGVCDGFIGNRLMTAYRTAADHMVLDGATPFEIDHAIEQFGFALGPFAVADLAGLDIGFAARKRRAPTLDPRARVGRYADALCEAGHFGRKTGRGYYVYSEDGRDRRPNEDVLSLIDEERADRGISPRAFSTPEIQDRFLAAIVNEAARVLEEGIARRPLDIDVVMLLGYGFPRFWGGPMKWADLRGLAEVLGLVEDYAREDDFFWSPAPLLQKLAAEGACFEDLNAG